MPQMSPLSWLNLYIFFSIALLISIIINFYIPMIKSSTSKKMTSKYSINWKW